MVYIDLQDKMDWQRKQWNDAGEELLQRIDTKGRSEVLSSIDAALAAAEWPLRDGQRWTAEQDGSTVEATFHLLEEGPLWEIGREWHRTGTEEEERVKTLPIPLKGSLLIEKEGRKMADASFSLEGEDVDKNGLLGLPDELSFSATALASDFVLTLDPCRLSGGESSFTCYFSSGGKTVFRFAAKTRGLRADTVEKKLEDPYWDESWRYNETSVTADAMDVEADYPNGIHIKGWMESRKLQEVLAQFSPSVSEEEAEALAREASACLHLNWYYEGNLEKPRAVSIIRKVHILNRFDDYWSWESGILCNDGLSSSLHAFFNGTQFREFNTDLQDFLRRLHQLMPFVFPA